MPFFQRKIEILFDQKSEAKRICHHHQTSAKIFKVGIFGVCFYAWFRSRNEWTLSRIVLQGYACGVSERQFFFYILACPKQNSYQNCEFKLYESVIPLAQRGCALQYYSGQEWKFKDSFISVQSPNLLFVAFAS